ncbi:MAG TPA: CAP domain-containing protein [Bacillota bacterium]|nr:CAP domain-containing protein [Bacillota bacterium]
MTRKFVMSLIVASVCLFTVAFDSPAKAASSSEANQLVQEKVEKQISEILQNKLGGDIQNAFQIYWQECFAQFNGNKEQEVTEAPTAPEQGETVEGEEIKQPTQEAKKQEQPGHIQEQEQAVQPQPNQQEQPTQAPEKQEQPEAQGELSQFEQEVIELTNVERSKQGLAPLQADVELSNVARDKSKDMLANNYFDHTSPTYGSPFDMMRSYGVTYQSAGENIAKGQRTPQEVVTAWMNSQGHRENILNGNYTHIGVGYVEQGNYWTQMFIGK